MVTQDCPSCNKELTIIEPLSDYHVGTQYCENCDDTYTWKSPESTREIFWLLELEG